ncbi:MAG: hypothetical protein ABFC96_12165 [Thermoguttaceae bacterium]
MTHLHRRWFTAAVIVLWLATMTWLVKEKVVPHLLIGDRPSNLDILRAQRKRPVGWRISIDKHRLGWAMTEAALLPGNLTEIHGRVHFDRLPLDKMMPDWIQAFVTLAGRPSELLQIGSLDAFSTLTVDALGNLLRLDSSVQAQPFGDAFAVRGVVDAGKMQLAISGGGRAFPYEIPMPPKALLMDLLSPQSELPGLKDGQEWTVPVYNPLSIAVTKTPVEIIFVTVEGTEQKIWGGTPVDTWRVVYRSEPKGQASGDSAIRGISWVRFNGTVIQQQVRMSGCTIDFVRLTRTEAAKLLATLREQWWTPDASPKKYRHD